MEETAPILRFKDTTATKKVFSLRKRIRAVAGGTSASKTISILVWCIDYAQSKRNELITVVSESFPHLEDGAMRDFKAIMMAQGYWNDSRWHGTKHEYTFETGTIIEFTSVDTYGKAHGPRRDVLFINECNNLDWKIVDQLIIRTRKIVWLDWNPSSEFWFYSEMQPNRNDIDFITLTYLDNEALDKVMIDEIEGHKNNKMWWQVYGLGQLGDIEGLIYRDWAIIDEVPHPARLEIRGMDFGYTNDPTVLMDIYKLDGGYIWDETLFQKGLSNRQIATVILNLPRPETLVVADSAEPKSIDEIKSYGVNIIGAEKGPDSVRAGIQLVQDQRISLTKRSINTNKARKNYMWKTDRDGNFLTPNVPAHEWSDAMDAGRYGMVSLLKKPIINMAASPMPAMRFPELGIL